MDKRKRRLVGGLAAAALAVVAQPVSAAPLDSGQWRDEGSEVWEDECGLTIIHGWDAAGQFVFNRRGRDGLAYWKETVRGSESFTNVATGKSYTTEFAFAIRDHQVIDNGDGTLTIVGQYAGVNKWFADDGTMLFIDSGVQRWADLIDHGGTPTDPSDDVWLEFLGGIKDRTGRSDTYTRDWCEDLHEFTT